MNSGRAARESSCTTPGIHRRSRLDLDNSKKCKIERGTEQQTSTAKFPSEQNRVGTEFPLETAMQDICCPVMRRTVPIRRHRHRQLFLFSGLFHLGVHTLKLMHSPLSQRATEQLFLHRRYQLLRSRGVHRIGCDVPRLKPAGPTLILPLNDNERLHTLRTNLHVINVHSPSHAVS